MFDYFANPSRFMRIANQLLLPLVILSLTTGAIGLYFGLFVAPADYQQGETVRIIYIHVPAAWLAHSVMHMARFSTDGFVFMIEWQTNRGWQSSRDLVPHS